MKAATSQREITPKGRFFPCHLMGHAIRTQEADGILDPLWATALLLETEGIRLLFISVELIGLEREYTDRLRQILAGRYGLPEKHIQISFIHTHSAPEYEEESTFGGVGAVPGYMDFVAEEILAAADGCFAGEQREVRLWAGTVEIKGCYGNRNGKEKPSDKSFTTLAFKAGEQVVAGAACFSCHSTVLGPQNRKVSSDLAGFAARKLQEKWGVYPLIMIGAAGDVSNRLYRRGNDYAELERMGNEMMDQVLFAPERQLALGKPEIRTFRFREIYQPDKERKQKQYQEIQKKIEQAETFDEKKVYSSALAIAERGLECRPFCLDLNCTYINLGDLKLITVPAELFSKFGLEIKEAMNAACPICWCYSNYNCGYLGSREDYGASFETAASDIPAGTGEKIVEQMIAFIRKEG